MSLSKYASRARLFFQLARSRSNNRRCFTYMNSSRRHSLWQRNALEVTRARPAAMHGIHRTFHISALPTILVPPVVFISLLVGLWAYKCVMMVILQDKIIYMPYMPPFTRSEKIEKYQGRCIPITWKEERIRSLDGTKIALCVGRYSTDELDSSETLKPRPGRQIVICYFQGNGAALPPRLPMLSNVFKAVHDRSQGVEYVMVALSYRGYWTSSGRASQSGIELDAQAMLQWVTNKLVTKDKSTQIVLWGQSIGAGVASTAAATILSTQSRPAVVSIVLETPFVSIKRMLWALYPQKWLPYRYLHHFLWNQWDMERSMRAMSLADDKPRILIIAATRDEVVPAEEADDLERLCQECKMSVERKDVVGALHTDAAVRQEGVDIIADFITRSTKT